MQRNKPLVQHYSTYTQEDFAVWALLFDRQMQLLSTHAYSRYLDALPVIGFRPGEIPDFTVTNDRLRPLTGWQLKVAPELVPQDTFFALLASGVFPATCWLRTPAEIDYIEEPDMFHDVFGHIPLLTDTTYATFMKGFGQLAIKWLQVPEAIDLLGRIYWFTIEFGLIREQHSIKVFGAGIISSAEETRHALGGEAPYLPFDITTMLHTGYRTDTVQPVYFILESFEQLCCSLAEIDSILTGMFTVKPNHAIYMTGRS